MRIFVLLVVLKISQCCLLNDFLFDESSSMPIETSPPRNLFEKYSKMRLPNPQERVLMEDCELLQSIGIPAHVKLRSDIFPGDFPEWSAKIARFKKRKKIEDKMERIKAVKELRKQEKAAPKPRRPILRWLKLNIVVCI